MSKSVDFYFDFASPFGYFASTKVEAVAEKYGRAVNWHPFVLAHMVLRIMKLPPNPEVPMKGDYHRYDVVRMSQLLGAPLHRPDMPQPKPITALRAICWMNLNNPEKAGVLGKALFARHWARGEDIAEVSSVVDEAKKVGVDGDALGGFLQRPEAKQLLHEAVEAALVRNVFGSPMFIVDDQPIWGADRLWVLEHWLKYGNWSPKES